MAPGAASGAFRSHKGVGRREVCRGLGGEAASGKGEESPVLASDLTEKIPQGSYTHLTLSPASPADD